jgi:hypothetical protein
MQTYISIITLIEIFGYGITTGVALSIGIVAGGYWLSERRRKKQAARSEAERRP